MPGPKRHAASRRAPAGVGRPTGPAPTVATRPAVAPSPGPDATAAPAPAQVVHLPARSVLADAPAHVAGADAPGPAPQSSPTGHRRRLAALLTTGLVGGSAILALAGAQAVLA